MLIDELKLVAATYGQLTGKTRSAISVAIFGIGDRNRFKRVFDGFDMKTANHDMAMGWFSAHWPEGANWPEGVRRPEVCSGSGDVAPIGGGAGEGPAGADGGKNKMEPAA